VTVRGYDDQGEGALVSGATVRLGSSTAATGAGGIATILVPDSPGTLKLQAKRVGMVRAFPREVKIG
jgi:hypothetical protein